MGGCEAVSPGMRKKIVARFARGQVSHPPFQIPEYAPGKYIAGEALL